jgi:hypothetical protein
MRAAPPTAAPFRSGALARQLMVQGLAAGAGLGGQAPDELAEVAQAGPDRVEELESLGSIGRGAGDTDTCARPNRRKP